MLQKLLQFVIKNRHKVIPVALCLLMLSIYAQDDDVEPIPLQYEPGKVIFEYADSLIFDKQRSPDYQLFMGNVRFRRDSMLMFCDSAYLYEKSNSLDAFGNVRMEQGDTLFVYGDVLYYDGNTEIARLRDNVRLINRNVTLYTDSLNYNQKENIGYYFDGGKIVDEQNELTSTYGQYSPDTKFAVFRYNVELINEKFILYSDTLRYNTESKIANIVGPSTLVSDSNTIYSDRGWYDTQKENSMLLDRSIIVTPGRQLIGDTIYYNRISGFGEVFGNMWSIDSAHHIIMEGQYGFYNEKSEDAFVTDSALVTEFSGVDTLYLHADTLKTFNDSIRIPIPNDSVRIYKDTITRVMQAYHNVRFFRNESQGVCDSMKYVVADSALSMYKNPIIWNANYQIFGDTIHIYMKDSTINWVHIPQNPFAVQKKDSLYFDQLSGQDLKAFFKNGELHRVDVSGNVESIFYPQERDSTFIGLNNAIGSYLKMFLKDRTMDYMVLDPQPKGVLTPIPDIAPDMLYLSRYQWFDYLRPIDKKDVFRKIRMSQEDIDAAEKHRPITDDDEEEEDL